jgi:hypothetical protein
VNLGLSVAADFAIWPLQGFERAEKMGSKYIEIQVIVSSDFDSPVLMRTHHLSPRCHPVVRRPEEGS